MPSDLHLSAERGHPTVSGGRRAPTSRSIGMTQISIRPMQTRDRLGAAGLVAVMTAYRDALRAHQDAINRLNVYPVPDGDTGTNMALTLEAVVQELAAHDGADLATTAQAVAYGSLMGARGNSGVILSQILRGLADAVGPSDGLDGPVLR